MLLKIGSGFYAQHLHNNVRYHTSVHTADAETVISVQELLEKVQRQTQHYKQ